MENPESKNDSDAGIRLQAGKELQQCFVLDASAGTGKTTVLISRILEALRTGGSELERIVAITFTEKAAGELKIRLRFELEQALKGCRPEEAIRLRQAVADLERAQVSTIHSFCAAMLHERPVEAGIKPDFDVLDELGADLLFERTWQEWLAVQMDQRSPELERLLRADIRLDALDPAARFLLEHRDLLHCTPEALSDSSDERWTCFESSLAQLIELERHCAVEEDHAYRQIEYLRNEFNAASALSSAELRHRHLAEVKIRPAAGAQKNWKPREALEKTRAILTALEGDIETWRALHAHNQTVQIMTWLKGFVERYEQAKREAGCLDFFDLLFRCRNLLKDNKRIRGYFQRRFDYILVDEFQDTDPLQIEILYFLAEKNPRADDWAEVELHPGKLFLVGDPKQSIYSFRRADIEAYHQAKQILARQGATLPLSLNFRSRPSVIHWINGLFARLIQPPETGHYQPSYQPIQASRTDGTDRSVIALPLAPQISLGNGNAPEIRTAEARTIAPFLRRIVDDGWTIGDPRNQNAQRPLAFGDIAILFRAKEAIDHYEEEFRDFDIPYRVSGGRRYYSRLETNALIALLSSLDNPGDEVAVVAALRSPFFGASDEELFLHTQLGYRFDYTMQGHAPGVKNNKPMPDLIARAFVFLNDFHRRKNNLTLPLLLLELYEKSRILPLFYLKPQGDQKVANLLKLVEMARSLEARGVTTLRAFVRYLKRMDAAEAEEGESPLAEDSEDVVRIMTIHKAKGLEFPLVILGDVAGTARSRASHALFNRDTGKLDLRIGPQDKALATLGWEVAARGQQLRDNAESLRLLYVAATRARDYFVLPLGPATDKERFLTPLWRDLPSADSIPWGQEIKSRSGSKVIFFDSRQLDTEKKELRPFRSAVDLRVLVWHSTKKKPDASLRAYRDWERKGVELRAKGRRCRRVIPAGVVLQAAHQDTKSPGRGPVFGSFVHELLGAVDFRQPGDVSRLASELGRRYEMGETAVEKAIEMVEWGLRAPVMQRAGRSTRLWKEVPFVYRNGEDLVEGFIDLVFEEQEVLVVVDFKTDALRNHQELEEKLHFYGPQGAVYALAVEAITQKKVKDIVFLFLSAKTEKTMKFDIGIRQTIERKLAASRQQGGAGIS